MEDKYLPIGTVCTINNYNKKVMITSYFSIEYNNSVVMYDYKGCVYPEGLLLPSQAVSFNHSDIVSVDFMGFKNKDFEVFNGNLNRKNEIEAVSEDQAVVANFQFDENGVVIFDPTIAPVSDSDVDTNSAEVVNPFQVNSTPSQDNVSKKDDSIFGSIKFDENGVVIEDGTAPEPPQSGFVFDQNGYVVSDNTSPEPVSGGLQFDENGVVIADPDGEVPSVPVSGGLQFDENGVVIADPDGEVPSVPVSSGLQFDENGVVIADPDGEVAPSGLQFDENGVVIADPDINN